MINTTQTQVKKHSYRYYEVATLEIGERPSLRDATDIDIRQEDERQERVLSCTAYHYWKTDDEIERSIPKTGGDHAQLPREAAGSVTMTTLTGPAAPRRSAASSTTPGQPTGNRPMIDGSTTNSSKPIPAHTNDRTGATDTTLSRGS